MIDDTQLWDKPMIYYPIKINLIRRHKDGSVDVALEWPSWIIDNSKPDYFNEVGMAPCQI